MSGKALFTQYLKNLYAAARQGGVRRWIRRLLVFGLIAARQASADAWPMAGHDPQRTGCSADYVIGPFQYEWVRYLDEKITFAQLIVWETRGYVGTLHGSVFALDLETGAPLWRTPVGGCILGSVATDGRLVFAAGDDGLLTALDAANGGIRWQHRALAGSVAHVLLVDGKVIYTDRAGLCYAVAAESGKEIWRFESGVMILHSPASDGARVFFGNEAMNVFALDLQTGEELWQKQLAGASFNEVWPVMSLSAGTVEFTVMPVTGGGGGFSEAIFDRPYPKSEAEHAEVQDMILDAIQKNPVNQVTFFLKPDTGEERFKAPILYNRGRWAPAGPACVDPNGNFVSGFLYTPKSPSKRPQYGAAYVGAFDGRSGRLLLPPLLIGVTGWDEFSALTLARRTVFRNHWSNVAVHDMDGANYGGLDMPGHFWSNRKEGGYPGYMGYQMQNGANGISISGDRVFGISSSHICCARGKLKGQ